MHSLPLPRVESQSVRSYVYSGYGKKFHGSTPSKSSSCDASRSVALYCIPRQSSRLPVHRNVSSDKQVTSVLAGWHTPEEAEGRKRKSWMPSSPHPWEFFPSPQYSHSSTLPWLVSIYNCTWTMGWAVQSSNPSWGKIFISSSKRPYRLWGPPSFLLNGYRDFSGGKSAGASC
jgi:hypothetical protein